MSSSSRSRSSRPARIKRQIPIVLYGADFWERVVRPRRHGRVRHDQSWRPHACSNRSDSVDDAFEYLTRRLAEDEAATPIM